MQTLKKGSKGEAVRTLQRLLDVDVDGVFGKDTEAAVKAFQAGHGLDVDGVVGAKTWGALQGVSHLKPHIIENGSETVLGVTPRTPWWNRVQSALAAERQGIGYYPFGTSDAGLRKRQPQDRWVVCRADNPSGTYKTLWTTGTCGHFATWLTVGVVGDVEGLPAATGMNLSRSWYMRSDKWRDVTPRSSGAVALLDGAQTVGNLEDGAVREVIRYYPCKGYASLFQRIPGCPMRDVPTVATGAGLYVVEMPSHVVVALVSHGDEGLTDPRTGTPLEPGCYRWAADGTKAKRGQPHTFREWSLTESGKCLHLWHLPPGAEVPGALDWRVTFED